NSYWLLPSLTIVVVILVAAGTASIALCKLRKRRAIINGNGLQNIDIPSGDLNATMISTTNNMFGNLTNPMTTNGVEKVNKKERHIYPRDVQCVQPSTLTTSECRTHFNLSMSENAESQNINEYEHVNEYAVLCDEYRSDETYLMLYSDSLGGNPTLNNIGRGAKDQHSCMTIQQIAQDHTVTTKPKKLVSAANSSHWYDKVYTKSLPKIYSSDVYNKVQRENVEEIRFRCSDTGLRKQEVINKYFPARSLAFDDSVASDAPHSTKQVHRHNSST
ncbi:hypothetical protein ACJMK2_024915, partial [Sinanodonta woodiana]